MRSAVRWTLVAMLALALPSSPAYAAANDRDEALASLRATDVVRVRIAAGAVVEGPWRGLVADSVRVGGERPVPLDQMDRVQVRRSSRAAYMIGIGVLYGLAAGWLEADRGDELHSSSFNGRDAALGAAAGVAVGALVGAHFAHWSTIWQAGHAPGDGLQGK